MPTPSPLRIAVIGVGAIGGLYGARLLQAGHHVSFVARGATLAALQRDGLFIESIDGDLHLPSVTVTDDPATIGEVDVVLVAVKATQIEGIAPSLRPLLGRETAVVPTQNGVEASAQLAAALGDAHVLEGLCRVIVEQSGPGRIRHFAVSPIIEFGPRLRTPADAPARVQIEPFRAALESAGIKAIVADHMDIALWEKFLFIEPFGLVGAATRVALGHMRAVPETRALISQCLAEVQAVSVAAGVPLTDAAVAETWKRYDGLPPESTSSMQRDIVAGRLTEYDAQTGSLIRLAQQYGVPVPAHQVLHAALLPMVNGAPRLG